MLSPAIPRWGWAAPPDLMGKTMGTTYRVRITDSIPRRELPAIRRSIEDTLADVEQRLSLYRSDSELSELNLATREIPTVLSPATLELVRDALELQTLSDGAFSPFTAPLVDRWGFGPSGRAGLDTPGANADPAPILGASVTLDGQTIRKSSAGVALDLNGIAKGDAVDRVIGNLREHGIENCLVEIGGEVACSGSRPDNGWRIGIQGPDGGVISRIELNDASVATSGDHIHYFLVNGRRYCHLMDPVTGKPIDHELAVASVVAENARLADAWSTALMVLGPEAGYRMAIRHDLAALLVQRNPGGWKTIRTPAYRALEEMTS